MDPIMDNIIGVLIIYVIGVVSGIWFAAHFTRVNYRVPMDALGIEKFQKCEIHTTNCHSNWYEIVWKKEKQK